MIKKTNLEAERTSERDGGENDVANSSRGLFQKQWQKCTARGKLRSGKLNKEMSAIRQGQAYKKHDSIRSSCHVYKYTTSPNDYLILSHAHGEPMPLGNLVTYVQQTVWHSSNQTVEVSKKGGSVRQRNMHSEQGKSVTKRSDIIRRKKTLHHRSHNGHFFYENKTKHVPISYFSLHKHLQVLRQIKTNGHSGWSHIEWQ